jgi:peptide deformylase
MNLQIARMGHPILRKRAEAVTDFANPAFQQTIEDLMDTFVASNGVGLAAPQILAQVRMVVFHLPQEIAERRGSDVVPLTVLINPIIEPLSEELVSGWEGCLSIPGMMGEVARFQKIRYRGYTPEGEQIVREAHGYHARVVQHECDHLDGILYPERMLNLQRFGFMDEVRESLVSG